MTESALYESSPVVGCGARKPSWDVIVTRTHCTRTTYNGTKHTIQQSKQRGNRKGKAANVRMLIHDLLHCTDECLHDHLQGKCIILGARLRAGLKARVCFQACKDPFCNDADDLALCEAWWTHSKCRTSTRFTATYVNVTTTKRGSKHACKDAFCKICEQRQLFDDDDDYFTVAIKTRGTHSVCNVLKFAEGIKGLALGIRLIGKKVGINEEIPSCMLLAIVEAPRDQARQQSTTRARGQNKAKGS